jgi:ribosomal protein L11 methyltransferase
VNTATTATCLRLLADIAAERAGHRWEMLDLGCGSGILALAAALLGAARVEAYRLRSRLRAHCEGKRGSQMASGVSPFASLTCSPGSRAYLAIITANLFSSLHIAIAPKLVKALAVDGRLVFSGILRSQEKEVMTAFAGAGLRIIRLVRKGKWVTGTASVKPF